MNSWPGRIQVRLFEAAVVFEKLDGEGLAEGKGAAFELFIIG